MIYQKLYYTIINLKNSCIQIKLEYDNFVNFNLVDFIINLCYDL